MQRLIAVGLGRGDEVLDAPILWPPQLVDVPQRLVALGDGVDDDAEGEDVEEAGQVAATGALDLAIDAVEVLDTA